MSLLATISINKGFRQHKIALKFMGGGEGALRTTFMTPPMSKSNIRPAVLCCPCSTLSYINVCRI